MKTDTIKRDEQISVSATALTYGTNPTFYGRMLHPDGYACLTGPCGDTDALYLRVCENKITEVKFTTDGCLFTRAACNAAAGLATGKTLEECLDIDQASILEHLGGLPEDHVHCALLAALTLHQAVNDYLSAQRALPAKDAERRQHHSKAKNHHSRSLDRKLKDQNFF